MGRVMVDDTEVVGAWSEAVVRLQRGAELLFLRRTGDDAWGGLWWIPGGAVEDGETPAQAARREVYEETGYRLGNLEKSVSWLTGSRRAACAPFTSSLPTPQRVTRASMTNTTPGRGRRRASSTNKTSKPVARHQLPSRDGWRCPGHSWPPRAEILRGAHFRAAH